MASISMSDFLNNPPARRAYYLALVRRMLEQWKVSKRDNGLYLSMAEVEALVEIADGEPYLH